MSVCTCSEGRKESLKKVTCWEPGSYSLWSRIEAFWIVNLLWASSFQNKISAPWEGNVSREMLHSEIWNATFERCAVVTKDELGNAQHFSFIVWILVLFFFFPSKGKNCEISKQVDTRLIGNILAGVDVHQALMLDKQQPPHVPANSKQEQGMWCHFLLCPGCRSLCWFEPPPALRQRWL